MKAIIEANKAANLHFFNDSTMDFFDSKIESKRPLVNRNKAYFVTSERKPYEEDRRYTVRVATVDGRVATVGKFYHWVTLKHAQAAAYIEAYAPGDLVCWRGEDMLVFPQLRRASVYTCGFSLVAFEQANQRVIEEEIIDGNEEYAGFSRCGTLDILLDAPLDLIKQAIDLAKQYDRYPCLDEDLWSQFQLEIFEEEYQDLIDYHDLPNTQVTHDLVFEACFNCGELYLSGEDCAQILLANEQ